MQCPPLGQRAHPEEPRSAGQAAQSPVQHHRHCGCMSAHDRDCLVAGPRAAPTGAPSSPGAGRAAERRAVVSATLQRMAAELLCGTPAAPCKWAPMHSGALARAAPHAVNNAAASLPGKCRGARVAAAPCPGSAGRAPPPHRPAAGSTAWPRARGACAGRRGRTPRGSGRRAAAKAGRQRPHPARPPRQASRRSVCSCSAVAAAQRAAGPPHPAPRASGRAGFPAAWPPQRATSSIEQLPCCRRRSAHHGWGVIEQLPKLTDEPAASLQGPPPTMAARAAAARQPTCCVRRSARGGLPSTRPPPP